MPGWWAPSHSASLSADGIGENSAEKNRSLVNECHRVVDLQQIENFLIKYVDPGMSSRRDSSSEIVRLMRRKESVHL